MLYTCLILLVVFDSLRSDLSNPSLRKLQRSLNRLMGRSQDPLRGQQTMLQQLRKFVLNEGTPKLQMVRLTVHIKLPDPDGSGLMPHTATTASLHCCFVDSQRRLGPAIQAIGSEYNFTIESSPPTPSSYAVNSSPLMYLPVSARATGAV